MDDEAAGANYCGPGRYVHYKGAEYDVLGLALHESQLYRLVIYRPLTPGSKLDGTPVQFWARPLDDFNQDVLMPGGEERAEQGDESVWLPRFRLAEPRRKQAS